LHDGETAETESPLPHPSHYKDWFAYFDTIDLRRHLQDVEIVLIEAALEKSDLIVRLSDDSLKLMRITLIDKMKNILIQKPSV
jgi:sigma-54 specific flagellar transcriptional regulator A